MLKQKEHEAIPCLSITFRTTPGINPAPLAVYCSMSSSSLVILMFFLVVFELKMRGCARFRVD